MANRLKKTACLLLTVTTAATLFAGCGSSGGSRVERVSSLKPFDDTKQVELSYAYWEDQYVVEKLTEGWNTLHPNAKLTSEMNTTADHNQKIINLAASKQVPDVFWVLGSPENMIQKGLLADMSGMWENDPDTKNLIGGVNDFKLGYFGTEGKWTTPVKFFPTVMFLNLTTFQTLNVDMPSADWTWEEFEQVVQSTSHDKYFGISEACTVITLYPIASDPNCIGEFGWDGTSFDLTNWADGLELEKEFIEQNYKAPVPDGKTYGDDNAKLEELYGEVFHPQDRGYAAIRTDNWWCWERFWNDSTFYDNKTFFVPYVVPHTEDNQDSKNMFATIDFGAISSQSENQLEAYYLLKYMTWGAEGWNQRLDNYDAIRAKAIEANGGDKDVTDGGETINNCPITLDSEVWAKYEKLHPNTETGDPIADLLEAAKLDANARVNVFTDFWTKVKEGKWTCYGSQQIPGFDTFLADYYFKNEFVPGYEGIEQAVLNGGLGADEQVADLTNKANELAQQFKDQLESQIQK